MCCRVVCVLLGSMVGLTMLEVMALMLTNTHLGIHHRHLGQAQRRSVPGTRWPGRTVIAGPPTNHMMNDHRRAVRRSRGAATLASGLLPLLLPPPRPSQPLPTEMQPGRRLSHPRDQHRGKAPPPQLS
ncbi:uncharacterized protein LY79DRAFT_267695 [Colletotrichum navitas]|uniref:Uncharacterized protein n=1 Tax=Colletotrichum navitas TaxID=681940 RepID=A0AAD8PX41_9PEZI|nr:uncharacterized protein LY79DRAFT_267695 [Colletotrichum navitas]KAK1585408.1 hypothetical protein LY79DRAFT_267695 [Colletotrichum navitas]